MKLKLNELETRYSHLFTNKLIFIYKISFPNVLIQIFDRYLIVVGAVTIK